MFRSTPVFNQPIGNWNTSAVTAMLAMFQGSLAFNQPLNDWNVSSVTTMTSMFNGAFSFNQPLNLWNTSNVTLMNSMFAGTNAFNQNIGDWNVSNVIALGSFMTLKTPTSFSTTNLDAIYNGWGSRPVQPNIVITFGTAKYTATSSAGRAILTNTTNLWSITDDGMAA